MGDGDGDGDGNDGYDVSLTNAMEAFLQAQAGTMGTGQARAPLTLTDDDARHKMFLVLDDATGSGARDGTRMRGRVRIVR